MACTTIIFMIQSDLNIGCDAYMVDMLQPLHVRSLSILWFILFADIQSLPNSNAKCTMKHGLMIKTANGLSKTKYSNHWNH